MSFAYCLSLTITIIVIVMLHLTQLMRTNIRVRYMYTTHIIQLPEVNKICFKGKCMYDCHKKNTDFH